MSNLIVPLIVPLAVVPGVQLLASREILNKTASWFVNYRIWWLMSKSKSDYLFPSVSIKPLFQSFPIKENKSVILLNLFSSPLYQAGKWPWGGSWIWHICSSPRSQVCHLTCAHTAQGCSLCWAKALWLLMNPGEQSGSSCCCSHALLCHPTPVGIKNQRELLPWARSLRSQQAAVMNCWAQFHCCFSKKELKPLFYGHKLKPTLNGI